MTPKSYQLLSKELHGEIEKLRRVQIEAAGYQSEFSQQETAELRDMRTVASVLTDIYQGTEKALQRIARTTQESLPSGPDWHITLLNQMRAEVPGLRPLVIQPRTFVRLENFLDFRHKVRNLYGFELDWDKLRPALAIAEEVASFVIADLEIFCAWLDALGEEN